MTHLPSVASIKVWKVRTAFRICLVSSAMFTRAQGVKNLPGMQCDHILQDKRQGKTRQDQTLQSLFFPFFYFNIIMAHKKRSIETQICDPGCVDFISNRRDLYCFKLLGSAAMQMYGDLYVTQKGYLSALHF